MMQNEKPTIESICEKSKALPQPESVVDNSEKKAQVGSFVIEMESNNDAIKEVEESASLGPDISVERKDVSQEVENKETCIEEKSAPTITGQTENGDNVSSTTEAPKEVTVEIQSDESGKNPPKRLSNDAVTSHTASLWKYNPIPAHPEPHDEYECLEAQYKGAKVIGASVRGKKHKHESTNRDDWFEATDFEDWTIVAVSDGAGSHRFSRIGARESCKAATTYIKDELLKQTDNYDKYRECLAKPFDSADFGNACKCLADVLQKSVLFAIGKVEEAFEQRKDKQEFIDDIGRPLKLTDFSGTFLISIVVPVVVNDKKETLILSCQIGDGMIAAIDEDAPFESASKLLCEPDSGSFSGETDFLVSPAMKNANNLMTRTRITRGSSKAVLMMSDGVADDYFPNETEVKRLYLDLCANGIIDTGAEVDKSISKKNIGIIKRIPEPIAYPWVNDPEKTVAIHYVKKFEDAMGCSLEELWGKKEIFHYASLEIEGFEDATNKADKLKIWLDNYVERGSFDDRTLVIVKL